MTLHDDLETLRAIGVRKKRVKARLLATHPAWLRSGSWWIEGPYARRAGEHLPESLHDAIRGIWTRPRVREAADRALPPWHARVPAAANGEARRADCAIAYLSNGGRWKLFDVKAAHVWTAVRDHATAAREVAVLAPFRPFFDIPESRIERHADGDWRCDGYLEGRSLAHVPASARIDAVRTLLRQFAALGRASAQPPDPMLTRAAVNTIRAIAPASLPAAIVATHGDELEQLGAALPLAPAHGDLSAQNVVVCGARPWVIDWDGAGAARPLLADVLYLVVREAALGRPDLLRAFLAGEFDAGVSEALAATPLAASAPARMVLLAHGYIVRFHLQRVAGMRDATGPNVDGLWSRLRPFCNGFA